MSEDMRIDVGQTLEPEIAALPDEEDGVKKELIRLLTTSDPNKVGVMVTDYVRGIEAWWNSKFQGGDPPVELVMRLVSLNHEGGTTSLGQVDISLKSKGGMGCR